MMKENKFFRQTDAKIESREQIYRVKVKLTQNCFIKIPRIPGIPNLQDNCEKFTKQRIKYQQ